MLEKKKDKFENFRAIWLFSRYVGNISQAEPLTKRFCLPTKSGLCPLTWQQCLEHSVSTEHNKSAVFHQNHLYYNLSAIILQKGPTLSKKRNLLEFLGTIESFWTILDISKRILELFSGKFRKDFDVIFRELSS